MRDRNEKLEDIWGQEKDILSKLNFENTKTNSDDEEPPNIAVYGNITLSEDEELVLRIRPEWAFFDKISKVQMQQDIEITLTPIRWNRISTGYREEPTETDLDPNIDEIERELEYLERRKYGPSTKSLDMREMRATDMKTTKESTCHNPDHPRKKQNS